MVRCTTDTRRLMTTIGLAVLIDAPHMTRRTPHLLPYRSRAPECRYSGTEQAVATTVLQMLSMASGDLAESDCRPYQSNSNSVQSLIKAASSLSLPPAGAADATGGCVCRSFLAQHRSSHALHPISPSPARHLHINICFLPLYRLSHVIVLFSTQTHQAVTAGFSP
jgi:hypothetical protein